MVEVATRPRDVELAYVHTLVYVQLLVPFNSWYNLLVHATNFLMFLVRRLAMSVHHLVIVISSLLLQMRGAQLC